MGRVHDLGHSPGPNFETIYTYKDFQQYIRAFAEGKFNALVLVGPPGVSKSEHISRAIQGTDVLWFQGGQLTPIQFYMDCYKGLDKPIILDDANEIMRTKIGKSLVMGLTDTRPLKTVEYKSSTKILEEFGVPRSFGTTSRVCYISNSWMSSSPESKALEDRAHLVCFKPPAKEVHLYVQSWFSDQEVYDYIGKYLHLIDKPSCRLYITARELKEAGMDWKRYLETKCIDTSRQLVQNLQTDSSCRTEGDRINKFVQITGLKRATYFNYKKALVSNQQMVKIPKQERLPPNLKVKGIAPQPYVREHEMMEAEAS